jgi:hypothetical protein
VHAFFLCNGCVNNSSLDKFGLMIYPSLSVVPTAILIIFILSCFKAIDFSCRKIYFRVGETMKKLLPAVNTVTCMVLKKEKKNTSEPSFLWPL